MPKFAPSFAALALLLAACSNPQAELEGDVVVNGMDPAFWSAKVLQADKTTTISLAGSKDIVGELPVKTAGEEGAVVLTSKTSEGDFVMTLVSGKCSDGMGDREYAWSVTAQWKGETLNGCAGAA